MPSSLCTRLKARLMGTQSCTLEGVYMLLNPFSKSLQPRRVIGPAVLLAVLVLGLTMPAAAIATSAPSIRA